MPALEPRFVYALIVDTSLDEVLNEFAGRPVDSLPDILNPQAKRSTSQHTAGESFHIQPFTEGALREEKRSEYMVLRVSQYIQ